MRLERPPAGHRWLRHRIHTVDIVRIKGAPTESVYAVAVRCLGTATWIAIGYVRRDRTEGRWVSPRNWIALDLSSMQPVDRAASIAEAASRLASWHLLAYDRIWRRSKGGRLRVLGRLIMAGALVFPYTDVCGGLAAEFATFPARRHDDIPDGWGFSCDAPSLMTGLRTALGPRP